MESLSLKMKIAVAFILVAMAPIVYVIGQNLYHSTKIASQLRELKAQGELYEQSITADSLLLESIKYDEGLEKYARENFFMQRKGEKLFIIKD